jgi:hypothetical protein
MRTWAGIFRIASWDERPLDERVNGTWSTLAVVFQRFDGDVIGQGMLRCLVTYRRDGNADLIGLQRISGATDDLTGSFLVETSGVYDRGVARGEWTIIDGTGTDGFEGIRGTGSFGASRGGQTGYELRIEVPVRP